MSVEFLLMYKWENLEDGNRDKFIGRLDALEAELSLQTKLGCPDITIPVHIPLDMYDDKAKNAHAIASKNYKQRREALEGLVELIKLRVDNNKIVNNEYLYELWISRIFELNWREDPNMNDPIDDINRLYGALFLDSEINPYDVDLTRKESHQKRKSLKEKFGLFKKKYL